jgi:hypothetical protein
MSNKYRTAHGKSIDIDKLRLTNERTIAVGNMKVNARGDQLGQGGKIIATRNELMNQQYKLHSPVIGGNYVPPVADVAPDGQSFDPPEDTPVVQPLEQKLRGTLADSIAKQATVEQNLMDPDMHKPKGPTRI